MKFLNLLFTIFFSFHFLGIALSQNQAEECKTDQRHKYLLQTDPDYAKDVKKQDQYLQNYVANSLPGAEVVYTVPVVVNVIHLGEPVGTGTNISDLQVLSAIDNLNAAYRNQSPYTGSDTEINFCLAVQDPSGNPTTGINRINGTGTCSSGDCYETVGITDNNEVAVKALSNWGDVNYYNFWIVSEIDDNGGGGGTQGYAYFSGASAAVDGAVVLQNSFGYDPVGEWNYNLKSFTNYNITTIHEVGHGLHLYHTFEGDGGGGSCPSNSNCLTDGDRVCDTPPHERSSGCPTGTTNLCGTSRDNHIHNFMDYSSDECQTEFTANQGTRMNGILASGGGRASYASSSACTPVAVPSSNFTSLVTSACVGTSITF